jgi:hypothetical protein
LFLSGFIALYLLPGILASGRRHNNAAPIWLVTIFLGWSFIGWLVALIWSTTDNVREA